MSPIIDIQRRAVELGRIRAGDKGPKGEPRKLTTWRLTSRVERYLQEAASLWGGQVQPWDGHDGEHELYTDTDTLPIMLLPGQQPTTWYEHWSKGGCQRRCDGVHELITDSACLCGDDRECKPITRLNVMLPDIKGLGSWLISSTGWNAAAELAGAAELLGRASAQGVLIPAYLRLEQRVDVKAGQTRRYAVPVIDIDVSFRDLIAGTPELGHTPVPALNPGNGVTLEAGLQIAEQQTEKRHARSSAPIPDADDIPFGDEPVPVDEPAAPATGPEGKAATEAQKKKLNVLVGTLRDQGSITTRQLWQAVAKTRAVDVDTMVELLGGMDEDGLHYGPLRDSLNRAEASDLIDRLQKMEDAAATPVSQ